MASDKNILDTIILTCKQQPEKIACYFLDDDGKIKETITYKELYHRVLQIAALLRKTVPENERALLIYSPSFDYIVGFLACLHAGVIAIPAYPPLTKELAEKLSFIINDAKPSICLTHSEIARRLKQLKIVSWLEAVPGLNVLSRQLFPGNFSEIEKHFTELNALKWIITDTNIVDNEADLQTHNIHNSDTAFLQYTSGTTNHPKGVIVSHENLFHNLQIIAKEYTLSHEDIIVSWLPPYHDMGLIGGILCPLFSGCPVYLMSPLTFLKSPIRWLQVISEFKATTSVAPNFAYELCFHKITPQECTNLALHRWQKALNGAEPIRASTLEKFTEYFSPFGFDFKSFKPCYGLAEATLLVSTNGMEEETHIETINHESLRSHKIIPCKQGSHEQRIVSSGHVNPNFVLKIVDPETKVECSADEIGEIWLAKGSVTKGYWQKNEETKETYHAKMADGSGPYLRSGDYGFIKNGQLYVTGRIKNMIIIHGRNYYPHDIELIAEHVDTSLRPGCSVAFSIEIQEEEQAVLLCELKETIPVDKVKALAQLIHETVLKKQGINLFDIVFLPKKSILKTTSGKLQRNKNRELYLSNKFNPLFQMLNKSTHEHTKNK